MNIFETIGMAWVIFTSAMATVAVIYLSFIGLKTFVVHRKELQEDAPVEVKEMFKIAR